MTLKKYLQVQHCSHIIISYQKYYFISRIRKYLNQSAAEQIIHAFVTSQLNNGNAFFMVSQSHRIKYLFFSTYKTLGIVTIHRCIDYRDTKISQYASRYKTAYRDTDYFWGSQKKFIKIYKKILNFIQTKICLKKLALHTWQVFEVFPDKNAWPPS